MENTESLVPRTYASHLQANPFEPTAQLSLDSDLQHHPDLSLIGAVSQTIQA